MERFGVKCPPDIPAKVPHKAAWPSLRSKHVETNKVNAEDAKTGEQPLIKWRYRVDRVARVVTMTRVITIGKSVLTPGGSLSNGHWML
mmetsp:Transcript_12683/g.26985  ORF Transcript_12683/g.26985 Transcript_12683/m.26985 type:complete len:88 (+) Transcript_12683:1060-1323(+)